VLDDLQIKIESLIKRPASRRGGIDERVSSKGRKDDAAMDHASSKWMKQ